MGKYFHIETLDSDRLLVIILSCELTSVYWNKLLATFKDNHIINKTVYFDFLYRNGYENRFFVANLNESSAFNGRLRRCDVPERFEKISQRFFRMHEELLASSALASSFLDYL